MGYFLNLGGWSGVFAVPFSLVDQHLKLCGGNELKVLLWVLRHSGEPFEGRDVAAGTGVRESLVEEALEYWIQQGILAKNGESLVQACEEQRPEVPQRPVQEPEKQPLNWTVNKKMLRPDGVYIASRMRECPELEHLMRESEGILGKTLSPSLAAVLLNAHDDYGLPCEVVMLIVSYAKSVNRTTTAYIEAMTKEWSESGIFTIQAAERKLKDLSERSMAWAKVSRTLGIPPRAPSKKEEEFAYKWTHTLAMGPEMILESYERCVNNTGKLQMSYMDKILSGWAGQGIATVQGVLEYEESLRSSKSGAQATYDISVLDKLSYFDLNKGQ